MDAQNYSITVRKGVFEGEECFEAKVREFPHLTEYADSSDEAYALAVDAIETTITIFKEKNKSLPVPMEVADDFSGRVTLRMPKSMHRAYSQWAEDEEVSLNQLIVNCLSHALGAFNHKQATPYQAFAAKVVPIETGNRIAYNRRVDLSTVLKAAEPEVCYG
ncbi:toxin-antitoxin system HicB family antitoxin [Rheinheimera baltica]|uniref:toxin-antitoxin system HicB family antitoxin n=1 Tax=Rheinheimera baltica TaxID=67576 RepID=UPI000484244C|nr:toxin-antitoxin system HicB family antitoxin [Rheinheimera baltica]